MMTCHPTIGNTAGVVLLLSCVTAMPAIEAVAEDEIRITRAEEVGMSSDRLERIVPGMKKLIDAGKIPGTVTVVARRGKVVMMDHRDPKIPPNPMASLFDWAGNRGRGPGESFGLTGLVISDPALTGSASNTMCRDDRRNA